MIRKLITTTLQDVAGYTLREAGDGMAALEAAVEERPEIVFLDYDMPRLNGIETCRRLRSDPVTADGDDRDADRDVGGAPHRTRAAAGADLFLTKPFSPLRLLRLVDELAAR